MTLWPFAARLAMEKGSATPTRKLNDGWIRSCSEQPVHITCSVCERSHCQRVLPGKFAATIGTSSSSAAMRNITIPRYTSIEATRPARDGEVSVARESSVRSGMGGVVQS